MGDEEALQHDWEMDSLRTRLEIHVIVYRCRACGCLQIKNGGPDAPSVFKPSDPGWSPFRTLREEPPCPKVHARMEPKHFVTPVSTPGPVELHGRLVTSSSTLGGC
jgi:hypothetical protein